MIKVFYQYISDRSEYLKAFMKEVKEYGKDIMFEYRKHKGSEWLNCHNDGSQFELYATGGKHKILTMDEKKYDEKQEEYVKVKRIVSYYDENFYPYPNNKDKSLDCNSIGKALNKEECDGTVIIDTETTGLVPGKDELLQVSIINKEGAVLFDEYIKPTVHSEWKAAEAVNHITPEMVSDCLRIEERINELQAIFDNVNTVIGYNTDFDIQFLKAAGIKIKSVRCIDVMREFAPIYGEWNEDRQDWKWQKLTTCAAYYGYDWNKASAHNSLGDCFATLHCYNEMQKKKANIESGRENKKLNNVDESVKWYPVKEYEGIYEISDKREVRSIDRYDNNGRMHKGKILKPQRNDWYDGIFVNLSKNGKQKARDIEWLYMVSKTELEKNNEDNNRCSI